MKKLLTIAATLLWCFSTWAQVSISSGPQNSTPRYKIVTEGVGYLVLEFLDDDLVHFELSAIGTGPDLYEPLYTTPYVQKKDYPGPSSFVKNGLRFETNKLIINVRSDSLCVLYQDKTWPIEQTISICPMDLQHSWKGFKVYSEHTSHVYGLGQYFNNESIDGDWKGHVRRPGGNDGNAMTPFAGGATGNTQIPVMYSINNQSQTYALFLDNIYRQEWNFSHSPWKIRMWGDQIRWYLLSGPDLKDLRRDYVELTGRPPLPPKKAFGLWVSEYGYDNWKELDKKHSSLMEYSFPLDGFVMDLQWFGGIIPGSTQSQMGTLTWDRHNFPEPEQKIEDLKAQGLDLMLIEESYVSRDLHEHQVLADLGFLAKDCENCGPTFLEGNSWWGKGGMIDWSHPNAGSFWHDWKRQPLIDMGVFGHWTDLGEPEMYNFHAVYHGFKKLGKYKHPDVHNVYNLLWNKSIYEGYQRHNEAQRPFIVSRSGGAGSQRYGVAMWSGDIGSNLKSLSAHMKAQMHMSLSGIDFYGSDIGGFHRSGLDGDLNDMYTRWFAASSMVDVPVRPHTENLCNCKETAPSLIGDLNSNLENIRRRYRLLPYYYSMAEKSHSVGDPLVAPLFYHYPNDFSVRNMGSHKMIGSDLLVAINSTYNNRNMSVYLPAGEWFDESNKNHYKSGGNWLRNFNLYPEGHYQLPLFVRAGAIIAKQDVPVDRSINSFGFTPGQPLVLRENDLKLEFYAHDKPHQFVLYEDDGQTVDYLKGEFSKTKLEHYGSTEDHWHIVIHPAEGQLRLLPRKVSVEFITHYHQYSKALVNGELFQLSEVSSGNPNRMSLVIPQVSSEERIDIRLLK